MKSKVTIKWNEAAIRRIAEDAGRRAMQIASEAAATVRCLDHHDIVRVLELDRDTGEFRLRACCEPAKATAQEAIARAFT